MVELRWLDGVLQYRTLRPTWLASGAWGEPSQWSEWERVPNVTAADTTDTKVVARMRWEGNTWRLLWASSNLPAGANIAEGAEFDFVAVAKAESSNA